MDRITGLPDLAIENILLRIPTLEAVRTCVLSKSWLYKWTKLPKLQLDVSFITKAKAIKTAQPFDYVHIVNSLLMQHDGPLDEFYLVIPILPHPQKNYISQVIRVVARLGLKRLSIFKWSSDPYTWPSSHHISPNLTFIELINCELQSEPFSRGFPNLTELVFDNVKCDADTLASCISNSSNLEKIELQNLGFDGHDVRICAPKLKSLLVKGMFRFIYLEARKLKKLEIYLSSCDYTLWKEEYLAEFFSSLRQLESLSLDAEIYGLLRDAGQRSPLVPLPIELGQLRFLKVINLEFCNNEMLRVFLRIINCSPCLNRLEIRGTSTYMLGREKTLRVRKYLNHTLQHLKKVYIGPVVGLQNDIPLIETLLLCSPALQEMAIWHLQGYNCSSEMDRLRCAYPSVIIDVHSNNRYENVFQTPGP